MDFQEYKTNIRDLANELSKNDSISEMELFF